MKRILGQPLPKCQVCGATIKRTTSYELWRKQKYCGRPCSDKRRAADMLAAKAKAAVVNG